MTSVSHANLMPIGSERSDEGSVISLTNQAFRPAGARFMKIAVEQLSSVPMRRPDPHDAPCFVAPAVLPPAASQNVYSSVPGAGPAATPAATGSATSPSGVPITR